MALSFRALVKWLVPSWLNTGDGEKVLNTVARLIDAEAEAMRQSLELRFPSRSGESALAYHGRTRGILRGRTEAAAHYANRLIAWRYPRGHRVRGSAFAALEQISEYFGGVKVSSIDAKGNYHLRTAAGVESFSYGNTWDWDGAGATPRWARFWIVLEPNPEAPMVAWGNFEDGDVWGGELETPGTAIGQTGVTADDVAAIRGLFRGRWPWKPAGTRAEWVIVNLDGTDQAPDGTWLNWSRNDGGTQVATRYDGWRYWSLSPETNNTYAGDPDSFCESFFMTSDDGSQFDYAGDPTNFPAAITLPDGSTYAGNPDSFPASFRLVDDGDLPHAG